MVFLNKRGFSRSLLYVENVGNISYGRISSHSRRDLEVPYIAEHIRNLAQSFDSKIPGAETLLVRQLGRYLFYPTDE